MNNSKNHGKQVLEAYKASYDLIGATENNSYFNYLREFYPDMPLIKDDGKVNYLPLYGEYVDVCIEKGMGILPITYERFLSLLEEDGFSFHHDFSRSFCEKLHKDEIRMWENDVINEISKEVPNLYRDSCCNYVEYIRNPLVQKPVRFYDFFVAAYEEYLEHMSNCCNRDSL